ncbi:HU family DNA-binding protein [Sphingosinicella sp. CPCC 101087]|uniref:HU family DNA-binding protein n=1 Tax=Sphingosinicella sp. CPCC 101087 TaxID=2497754 RepID=UPI00101BB07A|nr:HU family DNA-binding protein [Sphingosinicella sp. CPCC 101087]
MNNSDLADKLATEHELSKSEARKLLDSMIDSIADAAARGEEVSINGFGKFKVKETSARQGRNPSTGATIDIPAGKKLTFTPAKAVKERLNG